MEEEIKSFIKALLTVFACLTYCYYIPSRIPKGKFRLVFILPIIFIFTLIPWFISLVLFQLITGIFIAWLANFKLLLFAFGKYPLSIDGKPLSLAQFIALTMFPIKVKQTPSQSIQSKTYPSQDSLILLTGFAMQALIWYQLVYIYEYKPYMHPKIYRILYTSRMYNGLQIVYAVVGSVASLFFEQGFEVQFDNPSLCSSLQNFWGKRWNRMSSCILRQTIYEPLRSFLTPSLGKKAGLHLSIITTFIVSGLMHEIVYFYVSRGWPTWDAMWYFLMHGTLVAIEIEVKKSVQGKWRLHPGVSWFLAFGFVAVTSVWLLVAEILNADADIKEIQEYIGLYEYAKFSLRRIAMPNTMVSH